MAIYMLTILRKKSRQLLFSFKLISTQLLTLKYKKKINLLLTILYSALNNKNYLQWGTNTTKIQILITLTLVYLQCAVHI